MKIFDDPSYSKEEMDIIEMHLSEPLVVRYLRGLAQVAAMDVATSYNRITEDPVVYQTKNAFLQGTIAALSDLVDIAQPPKTN